MDRRRRGGGAHERGGDNEGGATTHRRDLTRRASRCNPPKGSKPPPSAEGDLHHLIGFGAARGRDLDAVALALADEGARQGRGHRETALRDVGLVLADDL